MNTTLYRFYANDGTLLYVGISHRISTRIAEHRNSKSWYEIADTIKLKRFGAREEALSAERDAIISERPKYNIVHNSDTTTTIVKLKLLCARCGKDVAPDAGYVHVFGSVANYRRQKQSWKEENPGPMISGTALTSMPDQPAWVTHHKACDPDPSSDEYWIDIERINSWQQIAHWSAQLQDKNWFADTNWSHFIYTVERDNV